MTVLRTILEGVVFLALLAGLYAWIVILGSAS
jgi:hypothetical protein